METGTAEVNSENDRIVHYTDNVRLDRAAPSQQLATLSLTQTKPGCLACDSGNKPPLLASLPKPLFRPQTF